MNNKGLLASIAFLTCLIVSAIYVRPTSLNDLSPGPAGELALTKSNNSAQIIDQYCVVCHNSTLKTGGLELDKYDISNIEEHPDVWERVLRKLRANAMPPTGMPRPEKAVFEKFESDLANSLDALALKSPNPGRTATFSRLNRQQYQNAIRDILDLDVDVSELLPKDDASFGFDNVNLTNLSPTLMERYLAAAQKISRLAIGSPLNSPSSHVELVAADRTQEDRFEGLPFGTRGGTQFTYHFPRDGEYRLDVTLARDRNENIEGLTESHEVEVNIDGERVDIFQVEPNRSERFAKFYYSDQGAGTGLQTSTFVKAGAREVGVTFIKKNSAVIESTRQPYQAHFNRDRHPLSLIHI